jgi:hypothetical protein
MNLKWFITFKDGSTRLYESDYPVPASVVRRLFANAVHIAPLFDR